MNLLSLLAGIPQAAVTYFTRKAELKAQAHENEMKRLEAQGQRQYELALAGLTADAQWEMEMARQASTSWKDEYTLLVISIPAILCFLPGGAVYVANGFAALNQTPVWYQLMFGILFSATVGVRWWRKSQSDT
jgi:hypothetical protein